MERAMAMPYRAALPLLALLSLSGCGRLFYEILGGGGEDAGARDAASTDARAGDGAAGTDASARDGATSDAECPAEVCGNGEDDDCDGRADEGCSCTGGVRLVNVPPNLGYDAIWTGSELIVAAAADIGIVDVSRYELDGTPIGPSEMLDTFPHDIRNPRIAWNGTNLVVAWDANDSGNQIVRVAIYRASFDAPVVVTLRDGAAPAHTPAIAWLGNTYGIAWLEGDFPDPPIFAAEIDREGVFRAGPTALSVEEGRAPNIVRGQADGEAWISWREEPGGTYGDIMLQRWSGGAPSGARLLVASGAPAGFVHEPYLAFSGGVLGLLYGGTGNDAVFEMDPPDAPLALPSEFADNVASDLVGTSSGWVARAASNVVRIDRETRAVSEVVPEIGNTKLVFVSDDIVIGVQQRLVDSSLEYWLIDCF
jgi:hypothetical protein